jgi:hypothetical protein
MDEATMNRNQVLSGLLEQLQRQPTQEPVSNVDSPVQEKTNQEDDVLELGNSFNLDRFQVVRREFFAHLREPAVTFTDCKFAVNMACLKKFSDTDYVQVLVNSQTKILALRPCHEDARDSYLWCSNTKGQRKPRMVTCRLFFAKIFSFMNWDPGYRYKLLGRVVHANDEYLLAFDLTATEVFQRVGPNGEKVKAGKSGVFPENWQDQFGMPYSEHKKSMQINIFDGYAVFAVTDPDRKKLVTNSTEEQCLQPAMILEGEPND